MITGVGGPATIILLKRFSEILKVNEKRPILEAVSKTNKKTREKLFELWTNAELEAFSRFKIIEEGMKIYDKFSDKKGL